MLLCAAELPESAGVCEPTPMEFTLIIESQQCKELLPSMPQPHSIVKGMQSYRLQNSVLASVLQAASTRNLRGA